MQHHYFLSMNPESHTAPSAETSFNACFFVRGSERFELYCRHGLMSPQQEGNVVANIMRSVLTECATVELEGETTSLPLTAIDTARLDRAAKRLQIDRNEIYRQLGQIVRECIWRFEAKADEPEGILMSETGSHFVIPLSNDEMDAWNKLAEKHGLSPGHLLKRKLVDHFAQAKQKENVI